MKLLLTLLTIVAMLWLGYDAGKKKERLRAAFFVSAAAIIAIAYIIRN